MGIGMQPIEVLWVLFIGRVTIGSVVIIIVVHISFAVAIFRDATNLPADRKPIFVGPIIWCVATLLGGIFVAIIYWIMHHSRLNQSVSVTPPED